MRLKSILLSKRVELKLLDNRALLSLGASMAIAFAVKRLLLLFFFPGLLFWSGYAMSMGGTMTGGGGAGFFAKGDHPVLLDFLLIAPDFKDSAVWQLDGAVYKKASLHLNNSPNNEVFSLNSDEISLSGDLFLSESSRPYSLKEQFLGSDILRLALDLVKPWMSPISPQGAVQMSFLYMTMFPLSFIQPVQWRISNEPIELSQEGYYLASDLELMRDNLAFVAHYKWVRAGIRPLFFQVNLNLKNFNILGVRSQAGTLLHEGLRHFQMSYSAAGEKFSERALQYATAIISLCKPNKELSYLLAVTIYGKEAISDEQYQRAFDMHCLPL